MRPQVPAVERVKALIGLADFYLEFYGKAILGIERNWRTYVDGKIVEAEGGDPESGWSLWARVETQAE